MTAIVIAFPNAARQPVLYRPLYVIEWTTAGGERLSKQTRDRDVIRRQIASCARRALSAAVKRDGRLCGGVMILLRADGSSVVTSHLEDETGA